MSGCHLYLAVDGYYYISNRHGDTPKLRRSDIEPALSSGKLKLEWPDYPDCFVLADPPK